MRRVTRCVVPCLGLLVLACGAPTGAGTGTATATATIPPPEPWTTPFTVRGRWADPRDISWSAEPTLEAVAFAAAIERAAAVWSASGAVVLRPVREGETADVTFGWRRGAHDACPAFGRSPGVAHSGPVGPGGFVHFDAGRAWDLGVPDGGGPDGEADNDPQTESLTQVAAHEWGHVLGLDHVPDPSALMSPDAQVAAPGPGDLEGLHSLYGGGPDGPGDVHLESDAHACILRGIAPADRTLCGLFDTDGDGASELLVLRTDAAGFGALTIYRFAPGPVLVGTEGPFIGLAPPDVRTLFAVDADGSRWIVTRTTDGLVVRLRRFNDAGRLVEPSPEESMALDVDRLVDGWATQGDVDGDGLPERLVRVK